MSTPATGYPRQTTTTSPWTSSSSSPSSIMCLHAGWLATMPAFAEDALTHEPRSHTCHAAPKPHSTRAQSWYTASLFNCMFQTSVSPCAHPCSLLMPRQYVLCMVALCHYMHCPKLYQQVFNSTKRAVGGRHAQRLQGHRDVPGVPPPWRVPPAAVHLPRGLHVSLPQACDQVSAAHPRPACALTASPAGWQQALIQGLRHLVILNVVGNPVGGIESW